MLLKRDDKRVLAVRRTLCWQVVELFNYFEVLLKYELEFSMTLAKTMCKAPLTFTDQTLILFSCMVNVAHTFSIFNSASPKHASATTINTPYVERSDKGEHTDMMKATNKN